MTNRTPKEGRFSYLTTQAIGPVGGLIQLLTPEGAMEESTSTSGTLSITSYASRIVAVNSTRTLPNGSQSGHLKKINWAPPEGDNLVISGVFSGGNNTCTISGDGEVLFMWNGSQWLILDDPSNVAVLSIAP